MPDRRNWDRCDLCGQMTQPHGLRHFTAPTGVCEICRDIAVLVTPDPPITGVSKELQIMWRGVPCLLYIYPRGVMGAWIECYVRLGERHPWWGGAAPTLVHNSMGIAARQPDPHKYLHFSVLANDGNEEEAKWTALKRMVDRARLVWLAGSVGEDMKFFTTRVEDGRYIRGRKVVDAGRGYRELLEEDHRNPSVHIAERTHQGDRVH